MNVRRFLFEDDFRAPGPAPARDLAGERALVADADRAGYERGLAEGRREAEAANARRLSEAVERLAVSAAMQIAAADDQAGAAEADGLAFFAALARALAGQALREQPLAGVAAAAGEAFRHLRGVPHLAARVHESLVEDVDRLLRGLARERGFEGRIIVLGDEELAPGDARLEWADGGIVRDARAIEAAVAAVMAGAGSAARTTLPEERPVP